MPNHPDTPEDDSFTFTKEPSIIEHKAYRDTWGRGLDSYLQWFYETAVLLHELLHENGSLYVHLDWHVGHYAKVILDELFGVENFRADITWKRTAAHNDTRGIGTVTDFILYYGKSENALYNPQFAPFDEEYLETFYRFTEEDGRRYRLHQIERNALGVRPNLIFELQRLHAKIWLDAGERKNSRVRQERDARLVGKWKATAQNLPE